MSQPIPVIYSDGVFKPLKRVDLPPEQQTFFIFVITKDDFREMSSSIASDISTSEQKLSELATELKSDLAKLSDLVFKFDEEHRRLFLENANALAPLIPSMISEEPSLDKADSL